MTAATVNSHRSTTRWTLGLPGRVAVLAVSLLAGSLGVAHAAPAQDLPQVVVSYGDLDLSSSEGVRELYKRIDLAARQVCPYEDAREIGQVALNRACRNAAISRAVRDVKSPQLVALRAERKAWLSAGSQTGSLGTRPGDRVSPPGRVFIAMPEGASPRRGPLAAPGRVAP